MDAVEGCGVFNTGADENFDLGIKKKQLEFMKWYWATNK